MNARHDRTDKQPKTPRDDGAEPANVKPSDAIPDKAPARPHDADVDRTEERFERGEPSGLPARASDVPEAVPDVLLVRSEAPALPEESTLPQESADLASDADTPPPEAAAATEEDQPEDIAAGPAPDTLPVLDAEGNFPADLHSLDRALSQWEWVATLVPGDPQFLPRTTTLRPEQLIKIDRGPRVPIVWLDPATSRPVLSPYGRETAGPDLIAGILAGQPRVPKQALLCPTSDGGPPLARPIVIVRLLDDQTRKVIGDALAAAAERDNKTAGEIAEDKVNYAFWSRNAQERAIMGDY